MQKFLKILFISTVVLGTMGYWAVEYVLPYSPIKPFRVNIAAPSPDYGLKYEPITLHSFDSLQLSGYYIYADRRGVYFGAILENYLGSRLKKCRFAAVHDQSVGFGIF